MSTVTDTTSTAYTGSGTSSSSANKTVMGKDDFLRLMIQQLKYQDPLNPMDGTAYASQLAQFSQLEQLSNLNSYIKQSIDANYLLTQSINNTLSADLVGKSIKVSGTTLNKAAGSTSTEFGYNLPSNASTVKVEIKDASGNVIKTIENSGLSAGDHKLSWDFSDNDGRKVADGKYTFTVTAKDANDNDIQATSFLTGKIDAIKFSTNGAKLVVDGVEYDLSEVLEIINNTTTNNTNNSSGVIGSWLK